MIAPAAIERLAAAVPAFDGPIGIAVSGGPDSLALLLLAADAWPGRVVAATVDHGLREGSAAEAACVADICAGLGIRHETLKPPAPITGSVQAAARAARFALLEDWRVRHGADWVMTAHHADDQAETLLMRLNRGAGVGGLAGVRRINGHVLRPLLGWRRAELAEIVAASGLTAITDPSNADPRFDRARIRAAIADAAWLDVTSFAASAHHLSDAEQALRWTAERLAAERLADDGGSWTFDPTGLPSELLRRITALAIARIDPDATPSGPTLDRLLESLHAGNKASLGAALCSGGAVWRVSPAPPRR